MALKGLNGLALGDGKLSVQKVPVQMAALLLQPASAGTSTSSSGGSTSPRANDGSDKNTEGGGMTNDPLSTHPPTCVVRLGNMTTAEDLVDDELYEELLEDVADECNRHGTVRSVVVPRPTEDTVAAAAVGFVFVHFTTTEGASKAKGAIAGRSFNSKIVTAVFYPEDLFQSKVYVLPDSSLD